MPVRVKFNHLPEMSDNAVRYLDSVIRREAFRMEGDMKRSMKGAKHGIMYGSHRASAPGESPARQYGNLVNSISTLTDAMPHTAYVLVGAEYAAYLEHGTRFMAPRPFIAPAAEKCRKRLGRITIPKKALQHPFEVSSPSL